MRQGWEILGNGLSVYGSSLKGKEKINATALSNPPDVACMRETNNTKRTWKLHVDCGNETLLYHINLDK